MKGSRPLQKAVDGLISLKYYCDIICNPVPIPSERARACRITAVLAFETKGF